MNLDVADIFDAVRRQAIEPRGWRQRTRELAAIEKDVSIAVAADEMAETNGVVYGRPAMGVDWDGIADGNAGVEDAHPFIFEDEAVMPGRSDNGIEIEGPGPRILH